LLASHALASGPLAASQPGFTILDPLTASLLGVFLFGEHIRTDAAALAGEALALAVVIAGAAALSRSSLIAGENAPAAGQHQAAPSSAASSAPATRPPADPADQPVPGDLPADPLPVRVKAERDHPAPAPGTGLVQGAVPAVAPVAEVDAVFAVATARSPSHTGSLRLGSHNHNGSPTGSQTRTGRLTCKNSVELSCSRVAAANVSSVATCRPPVRSRSGSGGPAIAKRVCWVIG
jgi:hypothetical protein